MWHMTEKDINGIPLDLARITGQKVDLGKAGQECLGKKQKLKEKSRALV